MNTNNSYKVQQKYYSNFSFFPVKGLKKHNYFVYKVYKEGGCKLNSLFENALNSEVMDVTCIIAIRKKILKAGIPLTESVIGDLQCFLRSVAKVAASSKNASMLYALETAYDMRRILFNYKEVQHQLTDEIKKLLNDNHFTTKYRTSAEDIGHVITILQKMNKDISAGIDCFTDFSRKQPPAFTNANKLIADLEKLLHTQQLVILQLRSWKRMRLMHEQQQVLN